MKENEKTSVDKTRSYEDHLTSGFSVDEIRDLIRYPYNSKEHRRCGVLLKEEDHRI